MTRADSRVVFERLKAILEPYAPQLKVVSDDQSNFYLDTHHVMKNRKPLCFGGVRIGKAYVSFYLMPVYANPQVLNSLSPELKKRMQGKSCFNFTSVDEKLFKELAKVTKKGFATFTDPKIISQW